MTPAELAAREEIVRSALAWHEAVDGHNRKTDEHYVPRAVVLSTEHSLHDAVRNLLRLQKL